MLSNQTASRNPFDPPPVTNPFDPNYAAPAAPQAAAQPAAVPSVDYITPEVGQVFGKAFAGLIHAVTQPLSDIKAVGEVMFATARESAEEQKAHLEAVINLQQPAPPAELDPETIQRANRGKALIAGMMVAGPAGSVVKEMGTRALMASPAFAEMPGFVAAAVKAGVGAAEGTAFGATFGALTPLDSASDSRAHAIAHNAFGGLAIGTVFGGLGAGWSALKPAATEAENAVLLDGLRAATREQATELLAVRQAQMVPEAMVDSELAAQVAAGTTQQAIGRKGFWLQTSHAIRTALDATKFALPSLKQFDQDTWSTALRAKSSAVMGHWFGSRAAQYVEFGMSDVEKNLFWRSLAASRGKQIGGTLEKLAVELEASGKPTALINGSEYSAEALRNMIGSITIPQLGSIEEIRLATSPAIAKAMQRYQQDILPMITDMRIRNGLTSLAEPELPFMALVRATPEDEAAGLATVGPGAKPLTYGGPGSGPAGFVKRTGGAKTALGQGTYVIDGKTWMSRVMAREFGVADRNEFAARIINAPWSRKIESGQRIPQTIEVAGEAVPAEVIQLRGNPQVLSQRFGIQAEGGSRIAESLELDSEHTIPGEIVHMTLGDYLVPKTVADGYRSMLEKRTAPLDLAILDAAGKIADISTTAQLAGPTEVVYHTYRALNALASQPGVGDAQIGQRLLSKMPWLGPRIGAIRDIFDYGTPASLDAEGRIVAAGAGSSRAFEQATSVIPMLHGGRDFLFGLPSQAAFGLDMRIRISALQAGERIAGRPFSSAEIQDYLANFGLYNKAFQSKLIQQLGRTKLNPFSATSMPMAFGEAQRFVKGTNLPASVQADMGKHAVALAKAEGWYRGVVGYAIAGVLMQQALTHSYPWENEEGHIGDIRVGHMPDGKAVYMPMPTDIARGMAITGTRAVMENFGPEAIPETLRQFANTAISFAAGGPPVGFAFTLLLGQAPYFGKSAGYQTQTLQVVPPHANAVQAIKDRMLTAAGEANPTLEKIFGVGSSANLPPGIRIINAITPGLIIGRDPLLIQGEPIAGPKRNMAVVVEDRVSRALARFPELDQRREYYLEEAKKEFKSDDVALAVRSMLLQDRSRRRGRLRSASQAAAAANGGE